MLILNKYYNLSLYPNPVLGTVYQNVKLISILDYNTALKFANVSLLQKQLYPYLPPGTNSDHINYTYYLFVKDGKNTVIAEPWIILTSVLETAGLNYTVKLNNVTFEQLSIVRDQLRLLGLSFDIV